MPRAPGRSRAASALVVDAEDRFTTMLAHQLRHLGLEVEIAPWNAVTDAQLDDAELVVCGPGPGDPREPGSARIRRMREVVAHRRATGRPLLAVCLSHQILADSLGIDLAPLAAPHQGLQKTVDVFGMPASIGFYNTFTARVARRHDARRRDRGRGRCRSGRRLRAARTGLRVGAGPPRVDPVARRHDDAGAAGLARAHARRRLSRRSPAAPPHPFAAAIAVRRHASDRRETDGRGSAREPRGDAAGARPRSP